MQCGTKILAGFILLFLLQDFLLLPLFSSQKLLLEPSAPRSFLPQQPSPLSNPTTTTTSCPQPPFQFLPKQQHPPRPVIQLVSFPASGNTWMRQLLEHGSGFLTGAVYDETNLAFSGRNVRNSSVLVVKTHDPFCTYGNNGNDKKPRVRNVVRSIGRIENPISYSASILLLRHPKDAVFSYFNYRVGGNHTSNPDKWAYSNSTAFPSFVLQATQCWTFHTKFYLHSHSSSPQGTVVWKDIRRKPVLVVYYDDVKLDPKHELIRIFTFINTIHSQTIIANVSRAAECALVNKLERFKRTSLDQLKNTVFSKWQNSRGMKLEESICEAYDARYWHVSWDLHSTTNCTAMHHHAPTPTKISFLYFWSALKLIAQLFAGCLCCGIALAGLGKLSEMTVLKRSHKYDNS